MSKQRAAHIAIHGHRPKKLRMIKRVKTLHSELQRLQFRKLKVPQQRKIEVDCTRPVERAPRGVPRRTQRVSAESRDIEIRLSIARIAIQPQGRPVIVRQIKTRVVDAVRYASLQRIISIHMQTYGKSRPRARDSRNLPPLRQRFMPLQQTIERKLV